MNHIQLGNTGILIEKNGFGALPIQRIPKEEAVTLLRRALDGGMNYFDTARAYTDSEEKLGEAFRGLRDRVTIASKTKALTAADLRKDLETSLRLLGTDHIDVYQFHNPPFCPKPGDGTGLYEEALKAREEGKIRFIGITNHRLNVAQEAIDSGLYTMLMFPYSYLSGPQEETLIENCRKAGMGFVAMKGMAGGLIRDGYASAAFMASKPIVVPVWGIQHGWELDQFLDVIRNGAELTEERAAVIEKDRAELAGEFCRGCGYCMPCPVDIQINFCARMELMLRRAPMTNWLSEHWQAEMHKIENCLHCYSCASKCPYSLDTPRLLQDNYEAYWKYLEEARK